MKIGIKYCGGCNPYYDRKKAVEELISERKEHQFELVDESLEYDMVLLVCGCQRTCIKNYQIKRGHRYKVLHCEKDFEYL